MKDLIIIGAGPAGVAAANYARARGMNVAIFEKNKIGGLISLTTKVSHYPGLDENESGESFGKKLFDQLKENGTEIIFEKVIKLELNEDIKIVKTEKGTYKCKSIIIATGSDPKNISLEKTSGIEIKPNAYEKLEEAKEKEVFVLGGSDGACKEAITLSKYAKKVHIVQIQDDLLTIDEFKKQIVDNNKFEIHLSSELKKVETENGKITKVIIKNNSNNTEEIFENNEYLVFAYIGQTPNNELIKDELELENGFIKSENTKTKIEGVFSCGDINVKEIRQISTAVSEGTIAGIEAFKYLNK